MEKKSIDTLKILTALLGKGRKVAVASDSHLESIIAFNKAVAELNALGISTVDFGYTTLSAIAYGIKKLNLDAGFLFTGKKHFMLDRFGIILYNSDLMYKSPDIKYVEWYEIGEQLKFNPEYFYIEEEKKKLFSMGIKLDGLNIVLDLAGGVTQNIAPKMFRILGARVTTINATPASYPRYDPLSGLEQLKAAVEAWEANLGVAYTSSGDGLAIITNGNILSGDHMLELILNSVDEKIIVDKSLKIDAKYYNKIMMPLKELDIKDVILNVKRFSSLGWLSDKNLLTDPLTGIPDPIFTSIVISKAVMDKKK